MKRGPLHLNILLTLPSKNWNITFHTFVMHSLNDTCCIKHDVKHKFIKYRENKLIVTTYVQNVRLWLKHKLAGVLSIGQLYHQAATAPGCTTQCGLPLFVRRSSLSRPVSCTFLNNFLKIFLVSCSYQKIPKSVTEHGSLLIPISFN